MTAVAIPSIGIAMEEALLVKWHKQPGDEVAADEPVAEIETDKATMDLESPVAGRLGPTPVRAGSDRSGRDGDRRGRRGGRAAAAPAPAEADRSPAGDRRRAVRSCHALRLGPGDRRSRPHTLSPRARRLAPERGAEAQRRRTSASAS